MMWKKILEFIGQYGSLINEIRRRKKTEGVVTTNPVFSSRKDGNARQTDYWMG